MLNIAEGEQRTDAGWTRVPTKTKETRSRNTPNVRIGPSDLKRSIYIIGSNRTIAGGTTAMKVDDCKVDGDHEHGRAYDGDHGTRNQRSNGNIEHID